MPILRSLCPSVCRTRRVAVLAAMCLVMTGCNPSESTDQGSDQSGVELTETLHSDPDSTSDSQTTQSKTTSSDPTGSSATQIRWEYQADEAFESTPALAAGRVFVADVMGKIYAIDHSNGKEIWKIDYDTGFLAAPVIRDDLLYIGDIEGNLYCLSASDGKEVWKAVTDGEINGSAAFHNDNILITSQDGKLYCFKQNDGSPVWQYQTDDQIRCSPSIAGDRTFLGGCDGRLHIVDLNTGQAAGDPLPLGGPTGSTPAITGSQAVVPIMDGLIYAFDWEQQKQLWIHEDPDRPQEYRNSPAISGDLIVVSSQFKQVDAISLETGKLVWRHTLRRRADASPVIDGDDVWIAATDGRLIRLDLATGQPRDWEYESRGEFYAAPLIVGNELLIADDNGVVRCFTGIKDGPE